MGGPATPTRDELVAAHHLAEEIVAAVEQDEKTPIEVLGGRELAANICSREQEAEIDHRLLVLAQLVLRQDRELDLLRSIATPAIDLRDAKLAQDRASESFAVERLFDAVTSARAELEELRR